MRSLSLLFVFLSGLPLTSAEPDLRVPAATAYLTPDAHGARVSAERGVTRWQNPDVKVVWFGLIRHQGALSASVSLRLPSGQSSHLRLSVAGRGRETTVTGQGDTPVVAEFGSFDISAPGYQSFTLESRNAAGENAGDLAWLDLRGPAAADAHFNLKPRRNAASVHLFYPIPPRAQVDAFYVEMTGLEDPLWTYYMACGWHRGYFGMQVNSPTERRIIFSVWDSGNEAVDRNKVGAEDRVTLVAKGDGVYAGDFGNEGTGGHSHLPFNWQTGERQRFLVTAEPVDASHTVFAGYYFRPDLREWMLISSWKAPKEGGYLRGLYSFSENFSGRNGHLRRKALYGNQWIRTTSGEWMELTTAKFSHDETGKSDRLDRFMGLENDQFFLSQGGFVEGFTEYGTLYERPATKRSPADGALPALPPLE